ncbi:MAG: hypothetical protein JXB62_17010 [Pirellulales bacterium]|nr:hypothetical protein [Pirellulales bacterium]
MKRSRHILAIVGLLGLSCLVQTVVVRRATTTALDGVRFARYAQEIDEQGLLPTVRAQWEQPLFPVWVWVVHEGLESLVGNSPSIWATSVQSAAAAASVLSVIPLYLLLVRLVGAPAALAGTLFYCLLPEVSRLGADGISDSTHLLFFCVAFWATVEYFWRREGRAGRSVCPDMDSPGENARGSRDIATRYAPGASFWLLPTGVAMALALLTRAEVLVLALAFWVGLCAFQLVPRRRQSWTGLGTALACWMLGLAAVLGPYFASVGALQPQSALARVLGRRQPKPVSAAPTMAETTTAWRLADGERTSFAEKEPGISIRRRGYAAAVSQFVRKLSDAFGYWIGALALFGAWRLRRSRVSISERFVQIFFVLYSLAAIAFAAAEGYLAPRHLLPLVVAGMGAAGYGTLELGREVTAWYVARRNPLDAWPVLQAAKRSPRCQPVGAWILVLLAAAACLPQTLIRHHSSRLGHRGAGEWLAGHKVAGGTVLDTQGWTGLYSGRHTYRYTQGPAVLSDPELAYLVMEKREPGYDSARSRTLAWLIEVAARPVAEFPQPSARRPNQQAVVVYQWAPERFARHLAAETAPFPVGEYEHVRVDRGVRR